MRKLMGVSNGVVGVFNRVVASAKTADGWVIMGALKSTPWAIYNSAQYKALPASLLRRALTL